MKDNMKRRDFMRLTVSGLGLAVLAPMLRISDSFAAEIVQKLTKTNAEWKRILSPAQYNILREEGTEAPFTSKLLKEKREGTYACVACDLPLFLSSQKYDSGTGWPSFFDAIDNHLGTTTDYKLILPRTEYHCARCGGHHGHVFEDGPRPTGLRYCNNGIALKFIPKGSSL
jgi:peptide-methionine (R)-S-oxide reductase